MTLSPKTMRTIMQGGCAQLDDVATLPPGEESDTLVETRWWSLPPEVREWLVTGAIGMGDKKRDEMQSFLDRATGEHKQKVDALEAIMADLHECQTRESWRERPATDEQPTADAAEPPAA